MRRVLISTRELHVLNLTTSLAYSSWKEGVISLFKWFLPAFATRREGGRGVGTLWLYHSTRTFLVFTATKIPLMYSFSGNSAASAPISTFMCLWAIYIVPGSVYIFPPAEQAYRSWEYINCSQTQECGNWDWGPDIPFLGIFVSKFRYFVFAVLCQLGVSMRRPRCVKRARNSCDAA